ncbi:hypothetical protein GCM10022281_00850 [Sphingomonas rosea]|uniref:Lipoprotein n=1 Tax=Sphingomonas rosea TaxID=335605 RepID=A0ABP7TGR1_9SPHN
MRFSFVVAASICATLTACASPQERISDTLAGYGLERARADCVGGYLQSELSLSQLLELSRAAKAYRARDPNPKAITIDDLLIISSEIRDPKIPLTVAKSAGRCGLVPLGFTDLSRALLG